MFVSGYSEKSTLGAGFTIMMRYVERIEICTSEAGVSLSSEDQCGADAEPKAYPKEGGDFHALVRAAEAGMVVGKTIFSGTVNRSQGVEHQRYINHLQEHFIEVVYITGSDVSADDIDQRSNQDRACETKRILSAVKSGAEVEIEQVRQALIRIIDELLLHDDIMVNLVDIRPTMRSFSTTASMCPSSH